MTCHKYLHYSTSHIDLYFELDIGNLQYTVSYWWPETIIWNSYSLFLTYRTFFLEMNKPEVQGVPNYLFLDVYPKPEVQGTKLDIPCTSGFVQF